MFRKAWVIAHNVLREERFTATCRFFHAVDGESVTDCSGRVSCKVEVWHWIQKEGVRVFNHFMQMSAFFWLDLRFPDTGHHRLYQHFVIKIE